MNDTTQDHNRLHTSEAEASLRPQLTITYRFDNTVNIENGVYFIRNAASGRYLDVTNFGGSGTQTAIYNFSGDTNQQWKITKQGDGSYQLRPMHNQNLALGAYSCSNGSAVGVGSPYAPYTNWTIRENPDGTVRFTHSMSSTIERVLDCQGGTANGTPTQLWDWVDPGNTNQKWVLTLVGKVSAFSAEESVVHSNGHTIMTIPVYMDLIIVRSEYGSKQINMIQSIFTVYNRADPAAGISGAIATRHEVNGNAVGELLVVDQSLPADLTQTNVCCSYGPIYYDGTATVIAKGKAGNKNVSDSAFWPQVGIMAKVS